ncbi:TolC family protein [Thalassotalea euphylliae]|uniref:TolC family protein n=1 Tax=Thalassotalea euphylliae TaxID=1655234 RepID=A0A3E0TR97_9GAMM|nr:TolC family protein [Thalassotalea euphylliae]REL27008.1 TolC family protein [Thalassotalea euphylliae]
MNKQSKVFGHFALCGLVIALASGCSAQSSISKAAKNPQLPDTWYSHLYAEHNVAQDHNALNVDLRSEWPLMVQDTVLVDLISRGLAKNYQLNASYQNLLSTKAQLAITQASDFPELNLMLNQNRRRTVNGEQVQLNNGADINLQLSYELDLWGKLSAQQQQAQLTYSAAKLDFAQMQNKLISQIVSAWYGQKQAHALLTLYKERATSLTNSLEIINDSYQLGLTQALDVYLAQNELSSELARISVQRQTVIERQRDIQLLVADYPSGQLENQNELALPHFASQSIAELPASILTNNYELQSSWLSLLAADSAVAVAHKQRFPSLKLTVSGGDTSDELSNLLSGNPLTWSISAAVTAPLFNAGKLKSLEAQARLQVKAQEQSYLDQVFSKFADIENQLSNHSALTKQLSHVQDARENAIAAEELSFNQYLKGLVNYTTVLEAQRRSFDAQTNVIQITHQIIQNRIALLTSIGGMDIAKLVAHNKPLTDVPQNDETLEKAALVKANLYTNEKYHDVN